MARWVRQHDFVVGLLSQRSRRNDERTAVNRQSIVEGCDLRWCQICDAADLKATESIGHDGVAVSALELIGACLRDRRWLRSVRGVRVRRARVTPRASASATTPTAASTSGADIACAQLRVTRPATVRKGRAWSGNSQGQRKG
jgi:hypothetical protein